MTTHTYLHNALRWTKTTSLLLALTVITACGGGDGGNGDETQPLIETAQAVSASALSTPISREEAARFLTQATFGPTKESVDALIAQGYSSWLATQFQYPTRDYYRPYWEQREAALKATGSFRHAGPNEINNAFWFNALRGEDQLRQRVAFALSQIFVISTADGCGSSNSRGAAAYFDMLGQRAFGTYRDLLEAVALHPVMGCYLSHLKNQKEDVKTGRVPDENFAREILQLFSIGLVQLNPNGTPVVGSNGQPVETYTPEDVANVAKVFTGWSWDCPDWPLDNCFHWGYGPKGFSPNRWVYRMRPYAKFHSTDAKKFFGRVVVGQQSVPNPQESLRLTLDAIANHPNVAPFIGKQLIQKLVTSNPSPAYVERVSKAFTSSGGSMKATVTAILMDPEARDMPAALNSTNFGKVREPILRLSAFLRAYGASSKTGAFLIWETHDPANGLGQSPLRAPSVFNFFRPGYTPADSDAARAGLVAPELQIADETSVAGYVNYLRTAIGWGLGAGGYSNTEPDPDVRVEYLRNPQSAVLALAEKPAALVEDINQRLMYGTMSSGLKTEIVNTISTITDRYKTVQTEATRRVRLHTALLLAIASPEFQVQK